MADAVGGDTLYAEAIVIDGTSPLGRHPEHLSLWLKGGVTVCTPTIGGRAGAAETLKVFSRMHRALRERPELMLVRDVADIRAAKAEGRLGLLFHFQGGDPIERDVGLLEAYHALGLRMVQLCYNVRNRLGDGCDEATDGGLSGFGADCVRKLNELGMVVDCAHTGYRTTLDAIAVSRTPVVISHGNPAALHPSRRNLSDDHLRAVAEAGGMIGVTGYPAFLGPEPRPTLGRYIDHLAYLADLVGIDRVGLALDYFIGQHPLMPIEKARSVYAEFIEAGDWSPGTYPPPPWHYPDEIETPDRLPALVPALRARGFADADIVKLLGGNWMRLLGAVIGDQAPLSRVTA